MRQLVFAGLVAMACSGCDAVFSLVHINEIDAGAPDGSVAPYPVKGLVLSYTFDGTDPYADASGHGANGTCVACPTIGTGKHGMGATFDGSQRIAAPALALPKFTVAAWLDAIPVTTDECPLNQQYMAFDGDSWQLCLGTTAGSTTTVVMYMDQTAGLYVPAQLAAGWHHFALTYDGSTRSILIDGLVIGTDKPGVTVVFDSQPISIGMDVDNGQPTGPFTGTIDDLKIFDRALTESDIATVANTP